MFTQPAASPASTGLSVSTASVSAAAATPASPTSRTSRLRGLSYLRSYTTQHLLSREHSAHNTHAQTANAAPNPTTTTTTASISTASHPTTQHSSITATSNTPSPAAISRSDYFAPGITSDSPSNSSSARNRLSQLVPTLAHPLGRTTSNTPSANPTVTTSSTTPPADSSTAMTRARSATASGDASTTVQQNPHMDVLPSIRFSSFHDPRATRPSLKFQPISRTLPTGSEIIRVGRYSERDTQPNIPINIPSAAPVGFKSKVVSRRHCEFWYEDGKWYIKDVKSSSGTFLNHIRLSPPGTESKPFPVNDGDIVQLGIDFKGGEEMIFRCVKMRLELNRGWQNKLNAFK